MKSYFFAAAIVLASAISAQEYQTYTAHSGHPDWRERIVDDDHLYAEYMSSFPGSVVSPRFHPDTRAWWVVMDGQIRFEIEGRQPFVAGKGSIVQAPKQTMFSLQTVGDTPALRFEVNIAKAETLFPKDAQPPKMPGFDFVPIRLARQPGPYGEGNKPHITFDELAQNPVYQRGLYVHPAVTDDRGLASFIYGYEKNLPPLNPKDRGHYHPSCAEFWLIMAGKMRYAIENQDVFVADVGDVVYVPPFSYHAPRFAGDGPACRLAMNGYPGIAHLWEAH